MTAEKLRHKYEQDLKELQDNCPHVLTQWMAECYAPGHFLGEVEICNCCEKAISRKN